MNILIIDDEEISSSYLEELVKEHFNGLNIELNVFIANKLKTANPLAKNNENIPDIIFIDIEMPEKNGILLGAEIKEFYKNNEKKPLLIYATAHSEYGYEAFENDAITYILKPFTQQKISNSLQKAFSILNITEQFILVKYNGINIKIDLENIIYFESELKYTNLVTKEKTIIIDDTIQSLEDKYPDFLRIHRSYLVNKKYIYKFFKRENSWFVSLKNGQTLPISRRQWQEIQGKLELKNFL